MTRFLAAGHVRLVAMALSVIRTVAVHITLGPVLARRARLVAFCAHPVAASARAFGPRRTANVTALPPVTVSAELSLGPRRMFGIARAVRALFSVPCAAAARVTARPAGCRLLRRLQARQGVHLDTVAGVALDGANQPHLARAGEAHGDAGPHRS